MKHTHDNSPVIVAMTGASGAAYGLRLLQVLLQSGRPVYLLVSKAAQMVLAMESSLTLPTRPAELQAFLADHYGVDRTLLSVFSREDWTAPIASGSHPARHMVVCPCTTGSLSAIAQGSSDNLLERAADVMLKERRNLILVVRETPLSIIHLENMLKLARAGAMILPANPGFYHAPQTIDDLVDFVVARVLDHLDVEHDLVPRWGAETDQA
ncbi:MAG: UbiX family flavin prenyltransferase [Proteobacteria bacterium]|jgi:4-hydroxy-3-polyprenylbenzoate decarboxylase|nr:UbiX family flavin prenyltransferase [Pseudomonadota bacterium]MCG6935002.1 UbiX family flavin prenyltransferase [Pseudomonadota bacterium]